MLHDEDVVIFLATKNPDTARNFYEDVLGLKFVADEPFALVFEVNGRMLRIAKVHELVPARHTVLGWKVSNIEKKVGDLQKHGVEFLRFDGMPQDALGIWTSPSGAKVAWFNDPDKNALSLTQFSS